MPVLRVTRATTAAVSGLAEPHARLVVKNLSAAPVAPLPDHLTREVRADARGHFSARVPSARGGDLVEVCRQDGPALVTVRLAGKDGRRPETTTQRLRLVHLGQGKVGFEYVGRHRSASEPRACLRFVNESTGEATDVLLDGKGCLPKDARLTGWPGDIFSVRVSDGAKDVRFAAQWSTLIVSHPGEPLAAEGRPPLARFAGSLYVRGIDARDPVQGDVGDCWLVSAAAAVAHTQPDAIRRMIERNHDGSFTVTFRRLDDRGRNVPHPIRVEPTFYTQHGAPLYGGSSQSSRTGGLELWFPLLEKAYAQWHGGYGPLHNGYGHEAFEVILGTKTVHLDLEALGIDAAFEELARCEANRQPVIVCSRQDLDEAASGLVSDHAYTFLGCEERDGKRLVLLRNPWGGREPEGDGKDDGVLALPLEDFLLNFVWAAAGAAQSQ